MKRRILGNFVCVLTAAIAVTTVLMTLLTYSMFERRVAEDLRLDARMLARQLKEYGDFADLRDMLRVTIVAPDGAVLLDNQADPAGMENHLDRREIRQALAEGEGSDVRESRTVDKSTFYCALRLEDGRVLRVAKEASSIWRVYISATPLIALLALLMIVLCAWIANALTVRLLRPLARMTQDMDTLGGAAEYPELEPFISMIRKQHEEILRSADMRVEFTANVSHELKTPLTSISGYAELIESGMATGDQAQRFAGEIHKSASRLLTLINDIIRLSQMDSPDQRLEMEPVDLAQIAENAVEPLRTSAQRLQVDLRLDVQSAQVVADAHMMEELIYNLCDNAIRYNVRGGSVRVEVRPVRDHVLLLVQDTGIGISREHQERVFERFYRVDKSRSKATGGTGLGLAIVKHIAARHDAQISMDSELGRGTTITVRFARYGWQERK